MRAAARSPPHFRQEGIYHGLGLQEEGLEAAIAQIEKDVPRTMTGHIFFRGADGRGQQAPPPRPRDCTLQQPPSWLRAAGRR